MSTLCNPMDCSPPGSSAHGTSQWRVLEWVAISYSSDFPNPEIEHVSPVSPSLAGRFFTTEPPGKPLISPHWATIICDNGNTSTTNEKINEVVHVKCSIINNYLLFFSFPFFSATNILLILPFLVFNRVLSSFRKKKTGFALSGTPYRFTEGHHLNLEDQ